MHHATCEKAKRKTMVGFLARLWAAVRLKEIVGKDKAGNAFYRQSRKVDGAVTERRWVEYTGDPNPRTLPVEWLSWLTGQRKVAPTPEEIMALEAHRKFVKMKVAMVEKEEEKRRFRSKSLQQDASINEMKPPEMSKFIEQVAALEGVSFDGEDKAFINESAKETPFIEETSSSRTMDESAQGNGDGGQDRASKPKERADVYEKWVPPS